MARKRLLIIFIFLIYCTAKCNQSEVYNNTNYPPKPNFKNYIDYMSWSNELLSENTDRKIRSCSNECMAKQEEINWRSISKLQNFCNGEVWDRDDNLEVYNWSEIMNLLLNYFNIE